MELVALPGDYAVCRLDPGDEAPEAKPGEFSSVTRTPDETSVVCLAADAPAGARTEGPFAALRVTGPLDFSLTGILAGLTAPLASAGVSVFAISTYGTDYLLVPRDSLDAASAALRSAGHGVSGQW